MMEDAEVPDIKEDEIEMDEDEEEEAESLIEEEGDSSVIKAKQTITGRNVTLNTLMDDGVIHPGKGVLSIDYLGQRFEADLLDSGKIRWDGSEEEFNTPSSWAHHCKRLVNPIKRSGCGWASVKYNNKKLDIWKSIWARKNRVNSPYKNQKGEGITNVSDTSMDEVSQQLPTSVNTSSSEKSTAGKLSNLEENLDNASKKEISESLSQSTDFSKISSNSNTQNRSIPKAQGDPLNLIQSSNKEKSKDAIITSHLNSYHPYRRSVSYSALGTRSLEIDHHTLVQCEKFDQHSKLQPFTVSVASNALLLMDFHCNLTKSEVIGYLGGKWDTNKQHLSIDQVFPAFCRLGDTEKAPLIEEDIRHNMRSKHMTLVGWYHSHPFSQSDPTLHDIDCQMSYQLKMRSAGSMYQPCLAFILSPFEKCSSTLESQIQAFWVMPNLKHPAAYNIPMHVTFSVQRDSSLTEDILSDMKHLSEYYSGAQDKLILKERWKDSITYVEKIRASIKSKLPEDQLDSGTFLDYMMQLLRNMK